MKTAPAQGEQPAPLGHLGIGTPRLPAIDYFPEETIGEFVARHRVRSVKIVTWFVREVSVIETTGEALP